MSLIYASDVAFTESVKKIQARKGSRDLYARMEQSGGWQTEITSELEAFIVAQRSFFLATSNSQGQPYIQHRGGPAGFLKVVDKHTLAFADYKGNRQFISQGNLAENPKAFLFLIDYSNRVRIKIWGFARVLEDKPDLLSELTPNPNEYRAVPEQVIEFVVEVWDRNCPNHIPQREDRECIKELMAKKDQRINELEVQLALLHSVNSED